MGAAWSDENMRMTDCYYEKKDWRACTKEASTFIIFLKLSFDLIKGENSCGFLMLTGT